MSSKLIEWILRYWKCEKPPEKGTEIDVIVPISYTTGKDRLVDGTLQNLLTALNFTRIYPTALLAYSNCSYPFPNADMIESNLKALVVSNVSKIVPLTAQSMVNSVDEAFKISERLLIARIFPKGILLVTGEGHSPSAYYIWKRVFPNAEIYTVLTPFHYEIQPDHPVPAQRSEWSWMMSNFERQAALRLLPLSLVRKVRHLASK